MKLLLILTMVFSSIAHSEVSRFRATGDLKPEDYLWKGYGESKNSIFNKPEIKLNFDIGLTSDCGRLNLKSTVQGALNNILDAKYFERIGQDILAASPMLITCYMSPTWCAILKKFRAQANFLAQLRFNQCKVIDKYVDGRVEDFYAERQQCVRKSIDKNDGNFEKAIDSCANYTDYDFASWSGGARKEVNKLLQSTAKWAGMDSEEAKRVVKLTTAFIGEHTVTKGKVSVDWGPRRIQFTPRGYLIDLKNAKFKSLCGTLMKKVMGRKGKPSTSNIDEDELKKVSGSNNPTLDRQTLMSLAYLPFNRRKIACRKLADALALGNYTDDMSKSLDFLASKLEANPHLPEKNKIQASRKRKALKDQVELTLSIENQNRTPINKVLFEINKEGARYRKIAATRQLTNNQDVRSNDYIDSLFLDCGDGIGCRPGR